MRFVLVLLMLASVGSHPRSGRQHAQRGGAVVEAPGVPETDGTAPVQIY